MRLLELSSTYDEEDNLKVYAKIYSKKSKQEYASWILIDEFADNEIVGFECTCKHWVIKRGQQCEDIPPCKHLSQLREWLNTMGWEVKEFGKQKKQNIRTVTLIE
jgi:hypothetical protein